MAAVGGLVAGRYRVVRPLATGGMSRVWLATDETLRRPVAIKQCRLPDGLTTEEEDLVRSWTLQDARAFARVNHPAVIPILDVVPGADHPWIVMEYFPSRSLLEVVDESGPLPPARVADIGLAVLDALNAAGRAGVLHLDVKPGNVLIADDGRVVLSDFGPVVTEQGIGALAGAGIILGSPNYVAPERLFDGVSTARADLWSLGATLYYAVEGRPPFLRPTIPETLRALADGTPDPPLRAGPLTGVLAGLLQRNPAARLTAAEVEERLRDLVDPPAPIRRTAPAEAAAREAEPRRWPAFRRAVVLATVVAVAAMLAAAAAGTERGDHTAVRSAATPTVLSGQQFPSSAPVLLPPGFTWWNDPSGFRVAVPSGWRRTRDGDGALILTATAGVPSLRIGTWTPEPGNVVAGLIAEERDVQLTAYRRIRIEALPIPPDAIWEYTYRDAVAGPMRGLERVTTGGGQTYRIEWRTPRTAWASGLPTLDVVLNSFAPLPGA